MTADPQGITHPFYDIEVEPVSGVQSLVKVLALDGRRFTYRIDARLTPGAIAYIKEMIDSGVVSDLIIEKKEGRFVARESPTALKKHG